MEQAKKPIRRATVTKGGRLRFPVITGEFEATRQRLLLDTCKVQWAEHCGEFVKRWRHERGFSQAKMADLLGVHIQTLIKWESKENPAPLYLVFALGFLEIKFPIN
jgi:DNA-binding XRE family transcriptional regulator